MRLGDVLVTLSPLESRLLEALLQRPCRVIARDELVIAIRSVQGGKNYLSPAICDRVIEGFLSSAKKKRLEPSWNVLTRRERQVIRMIAEGLKTREIADALSLSPKTVEKHRTNMMNKLDLHSVSAVTLYAIQSGLINE